MASSQGRAAKSASDGLRVAPAGEAGAGRRGALIPVGRETLQERVYSELRRSLIYGMFDAGEVLRIVELAEILQTSTMPVREALARLVSEQALEALPSRSVRVPLITRDRLFDLARARRLIEGQLTALAMPNLEVKDFEQLRALTTACEAAFTSDAVDNARAASELNHAFHFQIYQAAQSAVLIPIVESLWLQSGPYVRAAAQIHIESGYQAAVHHHWVLIDALEKGDQAAAVQALSDDITGSFNLICTRLDSETGSERGVAHG